MRKTTNEFSRKVRTRVVRLVLDSGPSATGQHGSRWQAVMSISAKIGRGPQTLIEWVKKAEVDSGKRAGIPTDMAESADRSRSAQLSRANISREKRRLWNGKTEAAPG